MKKPRNRKDRPVSDETRNVLDTAITNIVQALGSKASVLVFWDSKINKPGYYSTYGLGEAAMLELKPMLDEMAQRLYERAATGNEELTGLQSEINLQQRSMLVLALPIQDKGRFIAALCLLQPLSGGVGLGELTDIPALPGGHPIPESNQTFDHTYMPIDSGLVLDQSSDLVAQNARLVKRLVEENQWLKTIFSYSPDGILIVNAECKIIGFNPAFARLSGWTVEELRGRDCAEALRFSSNGGEDRCSMLCPLKLGILANTGQEQRTAEVQFLTKDGEERAVELSYSVILSSHGDVLGGVVGARDITARKEAEELQNTFLSVVSHELQTPIAIIKGYAGLYADETTDLKPEQVREKMNIIREESERLSKLVDNLLYASRIQAGGIELEHAPVDVAGLIRRVVQKMASVSKQHTLKVSLPDDLPSVLGDYDKIQEVLVNLIENAVKYSPNGGIILLEAEPSSTEVIVKVTDQGIGVPVGERQRIFERFSRLDSRYVRERKGAGLGLYICKAIVEAHGGRIWVESAPPTLTNAAGSRFCFSLPREVPSQLPVLFSKL